jgi:hypothetical protein
MTILRTHDEESAWLGSDMAKRDVRTAVQKLATEVA